MSTIEEMKEEKARIGRIGRLITDVLKAFERKYGVEVSRVELTRVCNIGERLPKLMDVTLEVKI